jgi:hypothetical protein
MKIFLRPRSVADLVQEQSKQISDLQGQVKELIALHARSIEEQKVVREAVYSTPEVKATDAEVNAALEEEVEPMFIPKAKIGRGDLNIKAEAGESFSDETVKALKAHKHKNK